MKKSYLLILVLVLMLMMSMSGCGKSKAEASASSAIDAHNATVTLPGETKTETDVDASTDATQTQGKGYLLAEQFVSKIQSGDTADILSMVDVKDATFLSSDAIVWVVERNGLADISGNADAKYTLTSNSKTSDSENITVLDASGNELITLTVLMDNNNDWKIDIAPLCVANFQIAVPADSTVTFNSIPVDAKYITDTYGDFNLQSIITLPLVTGQTVSVDVVTSFGTLTSDVLPVTSDTPLDLTAIPMALTEADVPLAVAYDCYMTAVENSATTGVVPAAAIAKYFSPNSNPSVLTDVSNNITDQSDISLSNMIATKITAQTNSIISIDFNCAYNFKVMGQALDHDLKTTILMEKQSDGTFLIYSVPDMDFFLEPTFG